MKPIEFPNATFAFLIDNSARMNRMNWDLDGFLGPNRVSKFHLVIQSDRTTGNLGLLAGDEIHCCPNLPQGAWIIHFRGTTKMARVIFFRPLRAVLLGI